MKSIEAFSYFLEKSGIYSLLHYFNKKKTIILMFHGITNHHDPLLNFDYKHVEVQKFESFLKYLIQKYSCIPFEDYMKWRLGISKTLPKNPLVITFDDGYSNNYKYLFPLIKKYNLPVTIFLPVDCISNQKIAWYDIISYCISKTTQSSITVNKQNYSLFSENQKIVAIMNLKSELYTTPVKDTFIKEIISQTKVNPERCDDENMTFITWQQVKEMHAAGVSFGSHSLTHPLLPLLSKKEIHKEISNSKKMIERKIGLCNSFSYPFGRENEEIQKQISDVGYISAVTTRYGKNTKKINPLLLKRIVMSNRYSVPIMILLLYVNFSRFHYCLLKIFQQTHKIREC